VKELPRLRKTLRFIWAFLAVYILWSVIVDVTNLDRKIDDEALIPCLMYLPPLGFMGVGVALFKMAESMVFIRFMRWLIGRFRKKGKEP